MPLLFASVNRFTRAPSGVLPQSCSSSLVMLRHSTHPIKSHRRKSATAKSEVIKVAGGGITVAEGGSWGAEAGQRPEVGKGVYCNFRCAEKRGKTWKVAVECWSVRLPAINNQ